MMRHGTWTESGGGSRDGGGGFIGAVATVVVLAGLWLYGEVQKASIAAERAATTRAMAEERAAKAAESATRAAAEAGALSSPGAMPYLVGALVALAVVIAVVGLLVVIRQSTRQPVRHIVDKLPRAVVASSATATDGKVRVLDVRPVTPELEPARQQLPPEVDATPRRRTMARRSMEHAMGRRSTARRS